MKKEQSEKLSVYDTVIATDLIKKYFEKQLCTRVSLTLVAAPLFISTDKGIQDKLSGTEKAVSFIAEDTTFEIVHSLAKWKRIALKKYEFKESTGIITDMIAIRKDDKIDLLHSHLVDQWDWEKIIKRETRTIETLKSTVTSIYKAIRQTSIYIKKIYPHLSLKLAKTVHFITSQELEDLYPSDTPERREYLITKKYGSVFIIGIGDKLKSGVPHDSRSPDYDDWSLDGDMLIFDDTIGRPLEITSMGIRVDKETLLSQLEKSGSMDRVECEYHQMIIKEELPLTIGGGIGKSRLCMLLLEKRHIAQVQASYWSSKTISDCEKDGIVIL